MKLPDFELERFFSRHEFTAKYLLCSSDCESMSVRDLLAMEEGAAERFQEVWLGYTESLGKPELRAAISQVYEAITPEQVLVFSGAEEAIFLFMQGMISKGDHVIVHSPCYQSLFEVANRSAASVDRWTAQKDDGWKLDLNELESMLQPQTRAIVINTPHNPTGWLMPQEDWKALHAMAAAKGILVFCDEVYRESEHDPQQRLTAGCDMGEHAISLGVMSKTYGLAGLRIGWIATKNQDVFRRLQSLKDYTTICNSAPSEFLAELALRNRDQIVDRNLKIIRTNLKSIDDFFSLRFDQFSWHAPNAGAIGFPKLLKGDIASFCNRLLESKGVLLAPATLFQFPGNYFRLGFGRSNMNEALEKLGEFSDSYFA